MRKGFSLIEVLVFLSITAVFFISAVSVLIFFLRNIKNQQYKIIASHYIEEASEWLKFQKDAGWENLASRSSLSGLVYCVNQLNFNNQYPCNSYGLPANPGQMNIFKRQVRLNNLDSVPTRIRAVIEVYWPDLIGENKVRNELILSLIEQL